MTTQTDIAKRLAEIAKELSAIAGALGLQTLDPPVFPEDAVRKLLAGICLGDCGRSRENYKFRRGNCPTCSQRVNAEIKDLGPLGERGLIERGRIAPIGFDPNPSALDKDLRDVADSVRNARGDKAEEMKQIAAEEVANRRSKKGK